MPWSRFHATYALLALLLIVVVAVLLLRPTTRSTSPCTHWAAPTGSSGGSCTQSAPCQPQAWYTNASLAQPGRVLCLMDGVYTGEGRALQLTGSISGTASAPITIRALNEGAVTIDGEFWQRPLDCSAAYWTVEGVNLKDGGDSVAVLRGNYCLARRVVAWSTAATWGIDNVVDFGGTNNTLEDGAAFGYATPQR